ncbi:hypothetical protein D3C72_1840070 [compost metagenome]
MLVAIARAHRAFDDGPVAGDVATPHVLHLQGAGRLLVSRAQGGVGLLLRLYGDPFPQQGLHPILRRRRNRDIALVRQGPHAAHQWQPQQLRSRIDACAGGGDAIDGVAGLGGCAAVQGLQAGPEGLGNQAAAVTGGAIGNGLIEHQVHRGLGLLQRWHRR